MNDDITADIIRAARALTRRALRETGRADELESIGECAVRRIVVNEDEAYVVTRPDGEVVLTVEPDVMAATVGLFRAKRDSRAMLN